MPNVHSFELIFLKSVSGVRRTCVRFEVVLSPHMLHLYNPQILHKSFTQIGRTPSGLRGVYARVGILHRVLVDEGTEATCISNMPMHIHALDDSKTSWTGVSPLVETQLVHSSSQMINPLHLLRKHL